MKIALIVVLAAGAVALAGDLTPPPGPVAPTMKTLDEVEPRIAINDENTPGDATAMFRITRSGSYYLTERFDSPDGLAGIRVLAGDVTIDLNGFDIFGDTDGDPGAPSAIGIDASLASGVWIRNGRIWNFNGDGIVVVDRARLENLEVRLCSGDGYTVGDDSSVRDCSAIRVDGVGFRAVSGASFESCSSVESGGVGFALGDSARLETCLARDSGSTGFQFGSGTTAVSCRSIKNGSRGFFGLSDTLLTDCIAEANVVNGFEFVDRFTGVRCRAVGNGSTGFLLGEYASLSACVADGQADDGIDADDFARIIDCVATNNVLDTNTRGIFVGASSVLRGCTAIGNSGIGLSVLASLVESCTAEKNGRLGIAISSRSTCRDSVARENAQSGIFVTGRENTIVGCSTSINGVGLGSSFRGGIILFSGSSSILGDNVVRANTSNGDERGVVLFNSTSNTIVRNIVENAVDDAYTLTGSNTIGTIQTTPVGAGPWDNFDF